MPEGYTQINIRLTLEQKAQLQTNAEKAQKKLGPFLRDLGLSYGDAASPDSQAKAERVAGEPAVVDPVAESQDDAAGRRVQQLIGSGVSRERAERQAKREGL
jgi:hypothetical protein